MPTSIMVSTLAPDAIRTVNDHSARSAQVNREVEQLGARGTATYESLPAIPAEDFVAAL